MSVTSARLSFLRIARAEPFRVFFPFGALLGAMGVALWPLYFAEAIATYPSIIHARLMLEGMMAAFIFGFLGTAGPRLTETSPFSRTEGGLLLACQAAACLLHLASAHAAGDAFFLAALLCFALALGRRFRARGDLPPPQFVLVALGLACGVAGSALLAWTEALGGWPRLARFGAALLQQGFVLFPALGAGAFLLRKFLDLESDPDALPRAEATDTWRASARRFAALALMIIGTYALEVLGWPRPAGLVRAGLIAGYLSTAMPFWGWPGPFLANSLRLGLASAVLAALTLALDPFRPLAGEHILFLGGFTVLVFTVGTRVIYGHSGQSHLFAGRLPFLIVVHVLIFLALLTRIAAEFGSARAEHLIVAAVLWLAAAAVWSARTLRWIGTVEKE